MASGLSTECVHAGEASRVQGAAVFPVFQSATFAFDHQGVEHVYDSARYTRCNNNPSQLAVASKLAALEGGESALVVASGMAAIHTVLTTFLSAGDHLLVQPCLYGGTYTLVHDMLPRMGVQVTELDAGSPVAWPSQLQPNTKVVYVETISNPTCQVLDLHRVVQLAHQASALAIIDNTFASPANFRPLMHGFDLVVESCTKYLNGHSDIIAGCVAGPEPLIAKVRHQLNHLGGSLDPHTCFLLQRGLKTLALRVGQQNYNALAVAQMLQSHPAVRKVHYPGIDAHPAHKLACTLFGCNSQEHHPSANGGHVQAKQPARLPGFGGVLSFELQGGLPAARKFMAKLSVATVAPSLGGVETLVILPSQTSHAGLSAEKRAALGITDGLVRCAFGIEDTSDLISDFKAALDQAIKD